MSGSASGELRRLTAGTFRPPLREFGLMAVVAIVDLLLFSGVLNPWPGLPIVLYASAGFLPLPWRTIKPVPVFCLIWLHIVIGALFLPQLRPTLGLLVAQYTVASRCERRTSIIALTLAMLLSPAVAIQGEIRQSPGSSAWAIALTVGLFNVALTFGAWGLGRGVRRSRHRIEDLEISRAAAAAKARADERHLIALELHDIVSHSVSVMVLQADGARAVLESDPRQADQALEHIGDVGRESVGELRRLLGVMADGSLAPSPDRQRQPGLNDLAHVIDDVRRAGLEVTLDVSGCVPPLPQSFERSVHRIVKESLTNSLKHSGSGTAARVRFVWSAELLILEIVDDGSGGVDDHALSIGYGLPGLRERAAALDGRLDAGVGANGQGYVVTATLPIPPSTATISTAVGIG